MNKICTAIGNRIFPNFSYTIVKKIDNVKSTVEAKMFWCIMLKDTATMILEHNIVVYFFKYRYSIDLNIISSIIGAIIKIEVINRMLITPDCFISFTILCSW